MSLFLNHNPPLVSLYLPPISLPFILLSSPLSIFSSLSLFLPSIPPFPDLPSPLSPHPYLYLSLSPSLPSFMRLPPPPLSPSASLRWVRGEHFRYKFTAPGSASAVQGKWWLRKRIGAYFPAVNLEGLRGYFQSRKWPHPHDPTRRE